MAAFGFKHPPFSRGLLLFFWLPLAFVSGLPQTCTLLGELDFSHFQLSPSQSSYSVPGSSGPTKINSQRPGGSEAFSSTTGILSRPNQKKTNRKLQIFFLGSLSGPGSSHGVSYDFLDTGRIPGSSRSQEQESDALTLGWALKKPKGPGDCFCPPKKREHMERTLIRYCGGYKDNNCCTQLTKQGTGELPECCQKWLCNHTDWAHGDVYLPKCFEGWKCD